MIESEQIIYDKYESQGYDVIKAGAPDLILLKDGKISFVEVKSEFDKLSEPQGRAFKLLQKHGFDTKVETVISNQSPKEERDFNSFMKSMTRRERNEYANLSYPEKTKVKHRWLSLRKAF